MATGSWENGFDDEDLARTDVPEIDGALLMQLLEESHTETDQERGDDQLTQQPLEAAESTTAYTTVLAEGSIHAHEGCEDCGLDGILSDHDSHHCSAGSSTAYLVDEPFAIDDDWLQEMEMAAAAAECYSPSSDDMSINNSWYVVDDCMDQELQRGYNSSSSYCYGEYSFMEQVYSPLWG